MACRGKCDRYSLGTLMEGGQRRRGATKVCRPCDMQTDWDGRHCPCCGKQLRIRTYRKSVSQMLKEAAG